MRIAFSKLNNKELYALALRTDEILSPGPIDDMGLRFYYDAFKTSFGKFETGMQHENLSAEMVQLADDARDDAYYGFEGNLRNYLFYPDEELKAKIKELLAKMAKFGKRVPERKYKEETTIILSVVNIVENGYMDTIERTYGTPWFNLLKETQANFEKTLREHTKAKSEDDVESATNARPELVDSLRNLFSFIPLHYQATKNENLGKIVSQLQVELGRF